MSSQVPDVAGWSVLELIGRGGFASVWKATRLADGVTAALKISHVRGGARLDREAEILRRLGESRCTPRLLDVATTVDGRGVLAMEHVLGQSLDSLADRLAAIRTLVVAVVALHDAGVAHLDLKPANVIVAADRTVVIDFGLARHADLAAAADGVDATGLRAGTVHYMSPEQCRGDRDLGTAADIYALGTIVHEWITGRVPFTGNAFDVEQAHLERRPPQLGCEDERLERLISGCLAKRASMRPTAVRVLAELDEMDRIPWTSRTTIASRTASRSRREVVLLGAPDSEGLAAAVSMAGGVIARIADRRVIVAFPAVAAVNEAMARARSLARSLNTGVRIHVAELVVRGSATGVMLAGRALDESDSWWNVTPIYAAPPTAASTHSLVGRVALLAELGQVDGLLENGPLLDLVIGESGQGKTAILRATAADARARSIAVVEVTGGGGVQLICALRDAGLLDELLGPRIGTEEDRVTLDLALTAVIPEQAAIAATAIHGEPPPRGWPAATCRAIASRALARVLRIAAGARSLALVYDDLDRGELVVIDAIEQAVLPGELRLWIVAAVGAGWRVGWGAAATQLRTHVVGALGRSELAALWRSLIAPVEFVPDAVIDRLAALSGGVPHHAVELASALRSSGALAIVDGVATLTSDELLFALSSPLFVRLAARALAILPPDLVDAARACAVLDDAISIEALDAITPNGIDAGVALERLAAAGLLQGVRFRSPPLRAAIELAIPTGVREQLHAAALVWGQANGARPAWLAHHATNAQRLDADDYWLTAADAARRDHDDVEAERCYGMVIAPSRRARALAGRGRVRVRLQRTRDAVADLDEALGLAPDSMKIAVMLDLATALDWADEHDRSEVLARDALEHARAANAPRLVAAAHSAVGRSHWRHERVDEAIAACERALRDADDDTRITTLTVHAPALAIAGRLDDSWQAFVELETACRTRDDRFHLGVCFGNRLQYWSQRGTIAPALDDLRRSIALAREVGHFKLERVALHSLAELLHWTGDDAQAEPLARRARDLQVRYLERHVPEDVLLLGRILAARDRQGEAAELILSLRSTSQQELDRTRSRALLASLVELATAPTFDSSAWTALIAEIAAELPIDEQLEALWFAIHRAPTPEPWLQRAVELSRSLPSWHVRFVSA